jgi:rhodanese-related sulfurtransferase
MEDINLFVNNNLLMIVMWFVLLFMLVNSFIKAAWDKTPQQVVQMMNSGDSLILDVRENKEFESGHIADSVHIPMSEVKNRLSELDKFKDSQVIVSCRSGQRSARTCSLLKKNGFTNISNLKGGIVAWESDKLPVTIKS